MKGGYRYPFFTVLLFPCLFIEFLCIFFYISFPLFQIFHSFCAFMDPVQGFKQFLWFYFTILCILAQVFFVSHSLSYEINCSKRGKGAQNTQMCFQCSDPVTHPVFIFIVFSQSVKTDLLIRQCISGYISVRPVHHFQKVLPASVSCCHMQICLQISADPVPEEIGKLFLHGKRHLIFHQRIDKSLSLLVCPEKDGCVFQIFSFFQSFFQCCYYADIFFSGIFESLAGHRHSFFIRCGQCFLKTSGITSDYLHGSTQDTGTAAIVYIQQNGLCFRIIPGEVQHDLRSGSPEMINGLVVVPHNKQIICRSCQHAQDFVLQAVDILKFIHQNMYKLFSPSI